MCILRLTLYILYLFRMCKCNQFIYKHINIGNKTKIKIDNRSRYTVLNSDSQTPQCIHPDVSYLYGIRVSIFTCLVLL